MYVSCLHGDIIVLCVFLLTTIMSNCSSVEISPSLAELQRETVGEVRSHLSKFRVECRDAADRKGWGMVSKFNFHLYHYVYFV